MELLFGDVEQSEDGVDGIQVSRVFNVGKGALLLVIGFEVFF